MLYLKACTKCAGDVMFVRAVGAVYMQCLQCAHTIETREDVKKVFRLRKQMSAAA